jgi:hypothetical protein
VFQCLCGPHTPPFMTRLNCHSVLAVLNFRGLYETILAGTIALNEAIGLDAWKTYRSFLIIMKLPLFMSGASLQIFMKLPLIAAQGGFGWTQPPIAVPPVPGDYERPKRADISALVTAPSSKPRVTSSRLSSAKKTSFHHWAAHTFRHGEPHQICRQRDVDSL